MQTPEPPIPQAARDDERARMQFDDEVEAEIDALMVVPKEVAEEVLADVRDDLLRNELAWYLASMAQIRDRNSAVIIGLRRSLEFAAHCTVCKRWNQRALDAMTPTEPGECVGDAHPGVQFNDPIGY